MPAAERPQLRPYLAASPEGPNGRRFIVHDLLRLNGIEYLADWVIDDLPQDIATPHGTITTIPYSVETNDIVIHALQHLPSEQFLKRCTDQFDRLYLEGASNARIMAISIHPYITGVPHRIK